MSGCGVVNDQAASKPAAKPPAQKIRFQVLDPESRPLSGVEVNWVKFFGPALIPPDRLEVVGHTDLQGRFEFDWETYRKPGYKSGFLFRKKGFANVWHKSIPSLSLAPFRMRRGYSMSGVIRDVAGKPIKGATIVSIDMLAAWESFLDTMIFAPRINVSCATSDAAGRFRLEGVLGHGLDLVFSHPSYLVHERFAVEVGNPLNIVLRRGSVVRGRVLDRNGRPYAGVPVGIKFDTIRWRYRAYREPVITDAKGQFEMRRTESHPYRFSVITGSDYFFSDYFPDTRTDIELKMRFAPGEVAIDRVKAPANPNPTAGVRLTVRSGDTGRLLGAFSAAALRTTQKAIPRKPATYWEKLFVQGRRDGTGGKLVVNTPFVRVEPTVIAVRAEGYATKLLEVETGAGQENGPLEREVRLEPESRISGVVKNLVTGKPVPGAEVAANIGWDYTDWRQDRWDYRISARSWPQFGIVTADKRGRFSIGGLRGGAFDVFAYKPGSPLSATTELGLGDREHAQTVEVSMLGPTRAKLSFTGAPRLDPSWRVRIGRPYPHRLRGSTHDRGQSGAVRIGKDGTATIRGFCPGDQEIELLVPHPFRLGGLRRKLNIRRFRITKEETALEVDLASVAPTSLRGRLRVGGSPIAMHRMLVVAEPDQLDISPRVHTGFLSLQGARAFVAKDGTFDLACPPGSVRLLVVDAGTGVIFHISERIRHAPGRAGLDELEFAVARVRVLLESRSASRIPGRLEVRCDKMWPGGIGRMAKRPVDRDIRMGAWIAEDQKEIIVYLPDAPVELWVRTGSDSWVKGPGDRVFAKVPYVPKPGETREVKIVF